MRYRQGRFLDEESILETIDSNLERAKHLAAESERQDKLADDLFAKFAHVTELSPVKDRDKACNARNAAKKWRESAEKLRAMNPRVQVMLLRLKATLSAFRTRPLLGDESVVLQKLPSTKTPKKAKKTETKP